MKPLALILLFALSTLHAQTHRFFYAIEYKTDSTQTHVQKKTMILDVNPDAVKYYDLAFLEKDSANLRTGDTNTNWTDQIPVTRRRNSDRNLNYQALGLDIYAYYTEDPMKWTLHSDTQTFDGLRLQKATTRFGGRNWTAWFTRELPVNEGPYKFRGLPGMIVLLYDDQKYFKFSLIKNQNLKETYNTANILEVRHGNRPFLTTEKVFTDKSIEHYHDPYQEFRQAMKRSPSSSFDLNGVRYSGNADLTMATREEQKSILRENNPIERDKIINYEGKKR